MGLSIERETRSVALFKPEDRNKIKDLATAIEEAAVDAGPKRMADADPVKEAVKAHDDYIVKALRRATTVGITALRASEWRALLAEHPPRKDVTDADGKAVESFPSDTLHGFNVETIALPLVLASIDPDQFDDTDQLAAFVDDLSDPDFSAVYRDAVDLNEVGGPNPKFRASSWLDRTSAVMSRSESASD